MDINATLIGQFISFALLVWVTMRWIWPPITKALEERQKKIAAGLEAAERSKRELDQAQHKALDILKEARVEATRIIDTSQKQAQLTIDEAKENAKTEGRRIIEQARAEITRETNQAKEALRQHLAELAIAGAEKLLKKNLDATTQAKLFDDFVTDLTA